MCLRQRRVLAFQVAAHVRSDAFALEEAFDRRVSHAHPDVLAHQRVRRAVVVPIRFDVVVDTDFSP